MKFPGRRAAIVALTVAAAAASGGTPTAQQSAPNDTAALRPTNHPRLPADLAQLWLVPASTKGSTRAGSHSAAMTEFAEAVKLEVDANYAKALPMFSQPALREGPLGDYAIYYTGLAELRLGRAADARRTFQLLASRAPVAVRARDVAEEGERRAVVEGGGVDAQVLAEERRAQRARRPRVPERGVQLGVAVERAARHVGRADGISQLF